MSVAAWFLCGEGRGQCALFPEASQCRDSPSPWCSGSYQDSVLETLLILPEVGTGAFHFQQVCLVVVSTGPPGAMSACWIVCCLIAVFQQGCAGMVFTAFLPLEVTPFYVRPRTVFRQSPFTLGWPKDACAPNQALGGVADFWGKGNQTSVSSIKEVALVLCALPLPLVRNLLSFDFKFFGRILVCQRWALHFFSFLTHSSHFLPCHHQLNVLVVIGSFCIGHTV